MRYFFLGRLKRQCLSSSMLIIGALLMVGCAMTPQPSVDVFIEAIEGQANSKIHPETGAITILQKGVAVTIEPLDEVEIYALTEDPHINPYVVIGRRGNVEPIYTIFEVTVLNIDRPRVLVEESATLIDKNGAQYANLHYAYFKDLYDNIDQTQYNSNHTSSYPYHYPHYPRYRSYLDITALEEAHAVIAASLFESAKLFKGAKKRGLLIFEHLHNDPTDMRISVSDIRIVDSDGKEETLKFRFDFKQIVAEN